MKLAGIAGNASATLILSRGKSTGALLLTTCSTKLRLTFLLSLFLSLLNFLCLPPSASAQDSSIIRRNIAGLEVAIWKPTRKGKAPLILYSHGFHGVNTASRFLDQRLADAGYFVVAPNHEDAHGKSTGRHPVVPFEHAKDWSDATYKDRGEDIQKLFKALQEDKEFADTIDFSKVGLVGHSLGGYTVLALSGAYPSWKMPGVKAVVALSPYCAPFITHDQLKNIAIPVMYLGGTVDFGITPTLKRPGGAFDKTLSPCYFVDFESVGHLGFTELGANPAHHDLVDYYALAFLNKYVRGEDNGDLAKKRDGVALYRIKYDGAGQGVNKTAHRHNLSHRKSL